MSDTSGSLGWHAALVACLLLAASRVSAQSQADAQRPEFLTRYNFHLSADALAIDDVHFSWDTHFGGDLDVVDYVSGRTTVVADYEAVLGDERRAFDPEQVYYTLEISSSYRTKYVEIAGMLHHVSRHLSDRPKEYPIAWNVLGGRAITALEMGKTKIEVRADAGAVVQHSYVDYQWTATFDAIARRSLTERTGVFVHGAGEFYGVDGSIAGRSSQKGGMIEGGVRFDGRAGAIELFAGYENRLDADPVNLVSRQWGLAGFRFLSR